MASCEVTGLAGRSENAPYRTHPAVKGARLYARFFLEDVRRRELPIAGLFVPETNGINENIVTQIHR